MAALRQEEVVVVYANTGNKSDIDLSIRGGALP